MHGGYWKHMVADRVLQAAALLCLSYREGVSMPCGLQFLYAYYAYIWQKIRGVQQKPSHCCMYMAKLATTS